MFVTKVRPNGQAYFSDRYTGHGHANHEIEQGKLALEALVNRNVRQAFTNVAHGQQIRSLKDIFYATVSVEEYVLSIIYLF